MKERKEMTSLQMKPAATPEADLSTSSKEAPEFLEGPADNESSHSVSLAHGEKRETCGACAFGTPARRQQR